MRFRDRLEGRHPNDGLVQLWRFRWAIAVLLLLALGVLFLTAKAFEPETLELGRRQVRAMKADPILGFRAPGTTLRSEEEHAAQRDPFGEGQTTSFVHQTFEMTGPPGETVDTYRRAAEASGWGFVVDGCSRAERATGAVFGKRFGEFDATLVVHAQLDRDRALDPHYGELGRRAFLVTLHAREATVADLSVDAGIHHNDVHCLRGVDPSDPDLQPPGPPAVTVGELCSGLSLGRVDAIAPDVEAVELQFDGDECWLVNAAGSPLFIVRHAREPRAYYEDRRLASRHEMGDVFLFLPGGKKDPGQEPRLWSAHRAGPLVISAGAALGDGRAREEALFGVARVLAATRG